MPGTKTPCITWVDISVPPTDWPSGTAMTSGSPLLVALAVFPLTVMPSLAYLADHCHWDPVTTSRSAGFGATASTRFTVTSPNESSRMTMASGAAKNVTRAPLLPRVCTGSGSSPRRRRHRLGHVPAPPAEPDDDDRQHAPDEHEHGYREPEDDEPEVMYLLRLRVKPRLYETAPGRGQRQCRQQQRQAQRPARAARFGPG